MFKIPELVIFDLDNTLYDFSAANQSGEEALVRFLGATLSQSNSEIARQIADARLRVKKNLGKTAASHSRLLYIRDFLNRNRISMHSSFALECEQVFWRAYLDKTLLFDGVEELISFLRLNRTKLVLITDLSTNVQLKKLAWLGLDKSFELVITSEEAGGDKETGKPETMLRSYIAPTIDNIWSIGDTDWDHLYPSESIFFKKVQSGKFVGVRKNTYEFSSFSDLLMNIK